MTNPASAFQPAIDALEKDLADLERQGNSLVHTINVLRSKAGLPPRPGAWATQGAGATEGAAAGGVVTIHSDRFTGKRLGAAVRDYLEVRKASGMDPPATTREIFDALRAGGFSSGAKDEATGMVVLRTMLRKNTTTFAKLSSGKYGLRSWYPNLKPPKATEGGDAEEGDGREDDTYEDHIVFDPRERREAAEKVPETPAKKALA